MSSQGRPGDSLNESARKDIVSRFLGTEGRVSARTENQEAGPGRPVDRASNEGRTGRQPPPPVSPPAETRTRRPPEQDSPDPAAGEGKPIRGGGPGGIVDSGPPRPIACARKRRMVVRPASLR